MPLPINPSYWIESTPATDYPPLRGEIEAEVAVLGGGIAGLTTAYLLAERGVEVVVIEQNRLVRGVTGYTTAKISSNHGLVYHKLAKKFGREGARLYGQANEDAIAWIAKNVRREKIDCDFRRQPAYTYSESVRQVPTMIKEADLAADLGLPARYTENVPLPFPTAGAVVYDDQAEFHPRAYLLALVDRITAQRGRIFEQTRALDVVTGDQHEVVTNRGTVRAKHVVVATHYPFLDRGLFFSKVHPKRSCVVAAYLDEPVPTGMFMSTGSPTYTIRAQPTPQGELVMFLGGSHSPGEESETEWYGKVEQWARDHFRIRKVAYRWSTQDNSTVDTVPYIGPLVPQTPSLHVATGFLGWGMSLGTVAGLILADTITGHPNPYAEFFSPNRLNPKASAQKAVLENAHVGLRFVADHLRRGKRLPLEALGRGEGAILRIDGEKVGVYRDHRGKAHGVSTTCTHLGCGLHFNDAEKSWDCPCHGSRFDYTGKVIQGPAVRDLERKPVE